jgi:TctA family transporter
MWDKVDKPNFYKALVVVLIALLLSLVGEFYFSEEKHFDFEKIPFFEGIFGLLGALFLFIVVKICGVLVSRKEEAYDRYYTS